MNPYMPEIRLALLDDHPIICRSFEVLCAEERDITVVGNFGHSRELLSWLRTSVCDVLVLDYILQNDDMDGLSLIKHLLAHYPKLNILLSTSMDSIAVIRTAYMLGVRGYIAKREESSTYLSAIRTIANGQRFIPPRIAGELDQVTLNKFYDDLRFGNNNDYDIPLLPSSLLTPREAEVIYCYLEGMEVVDIAVKLKRSRKTISGHKQSAMRKLGVGSDLELFKYRHDLFKYCS